MERGEAQPQRMGEGRLQRAGCSPQQEVTEPWPNNYVLIHEYLSQ